MSKLHTSHLNLGSNIDPANNLRRALELLHSKGKITGLSNVWETKSVGAEGPNYLNAALVFESSQGRISLKNEIIRPIEDQLGRIRGQNKYKPRTIDIDIILFDDQLINLDAWEYAFVIIPLAEILPEYEHPVTSERARHAASRVMEKTWVNMRPEVSGFLSGTLDPGPA